jgi:hypothetical protein
MRFDRQPARFIAVDKLLLIGVIGFNEMMI